MMLTRQQAIDVKYRNRNCDDQNTGTWRDQIKRCPSSQCPFFEFRQLTAATMKLRQEAKVEVMSYETRAKQESARIRLTTGIKQQHNDISETK